MIFEPCGRPAVADRLSRPEELTVKPSPAGPRSQQVTANAYPALIRQLSEPAYYLDVSTDAAIAHELVE